MLVAIAKRGGSAGKGKHADWQKLRAAAAKIKPAFQQKFIDAVNGLKGVITLDGVLAAMASGDLESFTINKIPGRSVDKPMQAETAFAVQIYEALTAGGTVAAGGLGPKLGIELRFDRTNPRALAYAQQMAGDLVTRVNDDTRTAIREAIASGFANQYTPQATAAIIKEHIGLLPRHAAAVRKRYQAQLAQGVAKAVALQVARAYSEKLLLHRATTIARHETLMASHVGQEQLWSQAMDQHLLPQDAKRKWIVTPDDRLCPICAQMAGKVTGVETVWDTPNGQVSTPQQIHVGCRCAEALVVDIGTAALMQAGKPTPFVEPPSTSGVIINAPKVLRPPKANDTPWPLADDQERTKTWHESNADHYATVKHQYDWFKTLSADERGAFQRYTGSEYRGINRYLRGPKLDNYDDSAMLKLDAERLVKVMERAPALPKPLLVHRGVTKNGWRMLQEIDDATQRDGFLTLRGITSTSLRPGFAADWGSKKEGNFAILEILTNRGVAVGAELSMNDDELEVLLPYNAKYKIRGVKQLKIGGRMMKVVQLELVE